MPFFLTRRYVLLGAAAMGLVQPAIAHQSDAGLTPQAFGAVADGATDDSAAVSRWLDHLIENSLIGYVPAGDYRLGALVSKRLQGIARFGITGAGSPVSRFLVPASNSDGAFDIDGFNSRRHQMAFSGFSLIVTGSAQIGLRVRLPEGGAQHQRSITMEDVWARSADMRTDHFITAFDLTGCWRPRLQDCGWDGPFLGVTDDETSARYNCKAGFNLDGCYDPTVEDCYVWGCETGISARQFVGQIIRAEPGADGGTRLMLGNGPMPFSKGARVMIRGSSHYNGDWRITPSSRDSFEIEAPFRGDDKGQSSLTLGPEGLRFKDNVINGVKTGIWIERPNGREPTCWINGNHINYRDSGIVFDGVKIIQMDQNNTYNEDRDESFTGAPVDLDMRNASEYLISGHVFHFDGHPRRIGIRIESDTAGEGDIGIIHHCIFTGQFATAILLGDQVNGVRVGPNLYPGKINRRVRDLGSGNTIL